MKEDVGLFMLLFSIIHFHNQQSQNPWASCVWNFLGWENHFSTLGLELLRFVKQETLV